MRMDPSTDEKKSQDRGERRSFGDRNDRRGGGFRGGNRGFGGRNGGGRRFDNRRGPRGASSGPHFPASRLMDNGNKKNFDR